MKKHIISNTILLFMIGFVTSSMNLFSQLDNEVINKTGCGLNMIYRSQKVTSRDTILPYMPPGHPQPITFSINELPQQCGRIEAAYIWWIVSDTNTELKRQTFQITDPQGNIHRDTSYIAGTGRRKGWAAENRTVCYRGDVLNYISGNGDYKIQVGSSDYETDGIVMIIVYSSYESQFQGHIIINDGLITNVGIDQEDQLKNFNVCESSDAAKAFLLVSDVQTMYYLKKDTLRAFKVVTNADTHIVRRAFWNFEIFDTKVQKDQNVAQFGVYPKNDIEAELYSFGLVGLYYQTKTCASCPENLFVNISQSDNYICPGDTVKLKTSLTAEHEKEKSSFVWTSDPPGFSSTKSEVLVAPKVTTKYKLHAVLGDNCLSADTSITVVVNRVPIAEAGKNLLLCNGNPEQLNASAADGKAPYKYEWMPKTGLTDPNVSNPMVAINKSAWYKLKVTDANGCVGYDSVYVRSVFVQKPVILNQGPLTMCPCDSVVLTASPDYAHYKWSTGATSQSIVVKDSGAYAVTVSDTNNCYNYSDTIKTGVYKPMSVVALNEYLISAKQGDTVRIPFRIKNYKYINECKNYNYKAKIRFNKTLLVPIDGTPVGEVEGNDRIIELDGTRSQANDTLNVLQFVAVMGNAQRTPVNIDDFYFTECPVQITMLDSAVQITGLCYDGGVRLFDPDAKGGASLKIYPNPVSNSTRIEYFIPSDSPVTIEIFNTLGQKYMDLLQKTEKAGNYSIEFSKVNLPRGVYYISLKTGTETVTKILQVLN